MNPQGNHGGRRVSFIDDKKSLSECTEYFSVFSLFQVVSVLSVVNFLKCS